MEPNQPGSKNLPDFKELHDRIIANPSTGPQLVIKTNLDPKDVKEENLILKVDTHQILKNSMNILRSNHGKNISLLKGNLI